MAVRISSRAALRITTLAFALLWLLALAPAVASVLGSDLLEPIRAYFHTVCHQSPSRSLSLSGTPLALCSRCFGIYTGIWMGGVAVISLPAGRWMRWAGVLALTGLGLNLVGWILEITQLFAVSNGMRSLLGVVLGLGIIPYLATHLKPTTSSKSELPI